MPYTAGDQVTDEELIVRRLLKPIWILPDQTISLEAFRPRRKQIEPGQDAPAGYTINGSFAYENGLSCEVKTLLTEPIGNDHWVQAPKPRDRKATAELIAGVPNAVNHPVIYDGLPVVSHCEITGNTVELYDNEGTIKRFADAAEIIHNPWT